MPHGWIILDKPLGLGSTQAVAAVKRVLRAGGHGKVKVGHGGTLDPLATGVLPIALGEATKLAGRMLDASKVYEFTVDFGIETDTLDLEGEIVAETFFAPSEDAVENIAAKFIGRIEQVPPAFSAIKVGGERSYARARAGETVELPARSVTIFELTCVGWNGLNDTGITYDDEEFYADATFSAHVSKGTYIRSLARDIARALGTLGHVTYLRRTKAGPFTLEHAISLDKLEELAKGASLENVLLPLEAGLDDIPALDLGPEQASMVRQGRVLAGLPHDDGLHFARYGHVPLALMEVSSGEARVVRGFNLPDVAE